MSVCLEDLEGEETSQQVVVSHRLPGRTQAIAKPRKIKMHDRDLKPESAKLKKKMHLKLKETKKERKKERGNAINGDWPLSLVAKSERENEIGRAQPEENKATRSLFYSLRFFSFFANQNSFFFFQMPLSAIKNKQVYKYQVFYRQPLFR